MRTLEKILARKTDAIITISQKQYHEIIEVFEICSPQKAHIIQLGLDLKRFSIDQDNKRKAFRKKYNIADHQIAIGIIGRIVPIKNHQLFVEAICLAQKKSQFEIVPVVIGDGDGKENLISTFEKLQSENVPKAIFTSWITEVDHALAGLDVVALTSLNEGTPVSLIEAQAASRPIITTNVGGVGDCMLDGKSGIIIHDFDATTLATGLVNLADDEILRVQMGIAGKTFVLEKFNYTRLVDDMKKLYHSLLKRV